MAANHLLSGILEPSKTVPTVALNCRLQARHLNRRDTRFLVRERRTML